MDTGTLIEAWGELGAIGCIALFLGFMITNLIKSQAVQNESLDKIAVDQAKAEETTSNVESILLKLLQRLDKSDDKLDRKFDNITKEINDLDNQVSEIKGVISRLNGKH